jgi:GNAT superfamily N-acetyltransferase
MDDPIIVRDFVPGLIGRLVALHAAYYAAEWSFGMFFEARVARDLAEFVGRFDPARDGIWSLHCDGRIEGAIAIDGLHAAAEGAHLRWFVVSERLRGQGQGERLISAALAHVDECAFAKTYLWTFAGLDAARHLYRRHGFELRAEHPGEQWGTRVLEQRFERIIPRVSGG